MCVDNFYENPDKIREFALNLNYYSSENGQWPGKRTKLLHEIDEKFFQNFCTKIFSMYYDFNFMQLECKVSTCFQLIEPYENDMSSLKNKGFIHLDNDSTFAGIIYLTPNINSNCGTSLYKLVKPELLPKLLDSKKDIKSLYYKDHIDDNFDENFLLHQSAFEETVTFKNLYNRMLSFDSTVWHGANNFYTKKEPRLTQVFFVKSIKSEFVPPLFRFKI